MSCFTAPPEALAAAATAAFASLHPFFLCLFQQFFHCLFFFYCCFVFLLFQKQSFDFIFDSVLCLRCEKYKFSAFFLSSHFYVCVHLSLVSKAL